MSDAQAIRLIVADDQPMIRKALAAMLDGEQDLTVVASVGDGAEAVRAAQAYRPDVAGRPQIRVIVLTTFDQDELVFESIMAGASAYLLKDAEESEIMEAIRAVARGEPRLSPSVAEKILAEFRRVKSVGRGEPPLAEELLTERERDVLAGVASGKANRDIARELSLAEGAVKHHVSTILSKLQLRSRTELAVRAVSGRRAGLGRVRPRDKTRQRPPRRRMGDLRPLVDARPPAERFRNQHLSVAGRRKHSRFGRSRNGL